MTHNPVMYFVYHDVLLVVMEPIKMFMAMWTVSNESPVYKSSYFS